MQKILRNVKKNYYINQCVTFKSNTKRLWRVINSVTKKTNDNSCVIESLKINNIETYDGTSITNEFSSYFSNVGANFASRIEKSKIPVDKYLGNITLNIKSVYLSPCNKQEILRLINKLPNKTSHGYDGVSNALLKDIKDVIIEPIVEIINTSLLTGCFSEGMKHAEIVPLFKAGPKNESTNYRLISLLITVSKL